MLSLVFLALAHAAPIPDPRPYYSTAFKDIVVNGYKCDGPPKAIVYYPTNGTKDQRFPVISFVHGYGSGGNDTTFNYYYNPIMSNITSYGFVIVSTLSAPGEPCDDFYQDLLTSVEANFSANGIPANTTKVGAMGQSSGGPVAIQAAASPQAQDYNISAIFALHPAGGQDISEAAKVKVPLTFVTGSLDDIALPFQVKKRYEAATVEDKSFGVLFGAGHLEAAGGPEQAGLKGRWPLWVGHFFRCHLADDSAACDFFYQHFCADDINKMTACAVPHH